MYACSYVFAERCRKCTPFSHPQLFSLDPPPIFETESPVFYILGCVLSLSGGGGWGGRVYTQGVLADGMQSTCKVCQTEHP